MQPIRPAEWGERGATPRVGGILVPQKCRPSASPRGRSWLGSRGASDRCKSGVQVMDKSEWCFSLSLSLSLSLSFFLSFVLSLSLCAFACLCVESVDVSVCVRWFLARVPGRGQPVASQSIRDCNQKSLGLRAAGPAGLSAGNCGVFCQGGRGEGTGSCCAAGSPAIALGAGEYVQKASSVAPRRILSNSSGCSPNTSQPQPPFLPPKADQPSLEHPKTQLRQEQRSH